MHKELLFALFGFEGNIFVRDRESGFMKVVNGLTGINPSEQNLLNSISRLGGFFKDFEDFVAEQSRPPFLSAVARPSGPTVQDRSVYLKALANGLNKLLEDYRKCILGLEEKVTKDPHLPLTHFKHALDEYQLLFPALKHVLDAIHKHKLKGGQILSLLDEKKNCGVPSVETAMEKLLFSCHGVFYRQLSAWVLYGLQGDLYEEFLIQEVVEKKEEQSQLEAQEGDGMETRKRGDSQTTKTDEGEQQRKVSFKVEAKPKAKQEAKAEAAPSVTTYTICHKMLPEYIPLRVAEKILFIGESVKMFSREQSVQVEGDGGIKRSVLSREQASKFAGMIRELHQKPIFSIWEFEGVINRIREHVSENLWKLIVEDADLVRHLQTVKNFYLLGRGELFLRFMDQAQSILRRQVVDTTLHDVNVAFQQSLLQMEIEAEEMTTHFKLSISSQGDQASEVDETRSVWSALGMAYSPPWPLHILFTPNILDRYNVLFKFLLSIRRVQTGLQKAWRLQMLRREPISSIWQLRNHMAFLIDNVQYYVQVDVLESQFSLLVQNIVSTLDFESIKLAHERFVATLEGQLFLFMPPVLSCLNDILGTCGSFCAILDSSQLDFSDRDKSQIRLLSTDFERQSSLLLRLLTSMKNHQHSPHLAQMMLRVDYNKFFSEHF